MKTIVAISDPQWPYTHGGAVKALTNFIETYQPDELLCVGDELDSPEPSRWNKGMAGEYAGTLKKSIDGCHEMMRSFREALGPDKPFHVMRSNHNDRVETYIRRYAPALECLPELKVDKLLRYDEIGVTYHRQMYEFAPNTLLAHGDEGNLSSIAGMTGLKLAEKTGKNVVIGHCHRLAVVSKSVGFNGKIKTITAMETGHIMDMRKAEYLATGAGNWQMGFGVVLVDGRTVTMIPVPMNADGSFLFDGHRWTP